jgi:hypothetical protein
MAACSFWPSTLFLDDRFITEKIDAFARVCGNSDIHEGGFSPSIDWDLHGLLRHPESIHAWHLAIKSHPNPDISAGVVLGSRYRPLLGHLTDALDPAPATEIRNAVGYVDSRLPGLTDLFERVLVRKPATRE